MRKGIYKNCFMAVMVLVVLCSGCRRTKDVGGSEDDILNPGAVDGGELVLGERFEDGIRVSPEEFSVSAVSFQYDSYKIESSEIVKIERTADFMKRKKEVRLVVEGHCDERGSREYNMSLGEHRALAIRAYLVKLGIESVRIQTRSFGEEKPIDQGHDERAWRLNRRGEFALYR